MHDVGGLGITLRLRASSGARRALELFRTGLCLGFLAKRRQGPGRQLSSELVEEVLAAGLLEVLLAHGRATLEAGVDESRWASHDARRVDLRLAQLLIDLVLVLGVERGHLGLFAVEELPGHTGLSDRNRHATLELLANTALAEIGRLRDDDVLAAVVVSGTITQVLGLLDGGLAVALIKVRDDRRVQILDFFLQWR